MNNWKYRILSRIKIVGTCWEWQGTTKGFGYGSMTVGSRSDGTRRTTTSHRVSYEAFNGKIKDDLWVLHKCDNPKCCNPEHLYLGDRSQNVKDMMNRGRLNHVYGERASNSKLTDNDVVSIRNDRFELGLTYRELAKKYGLKSHKSVMQICNGQSWCHVPEPPEN